MAKKVDPKVMARRPQDSDTGSSNIPTKPSTTVATGAQDEVSALLEQTHEKPQQKFRKSINPILFWTLVVLGVIASIAVVAWLCLAFSGAKGAGDAILKHSQESPQSYILPACRHLLAAAGSFSLYNKSKCYSWSQIDHTPRRCLACAL